MPLFDTGMPTVGTTTPKTPAKTQTATSAEGAPAPSMPGFGTRAAAGLPPITQSWQSAMQDYINKQTSPQATTLQQQLDMLKGTPMGAAFEDLLSNNDTIGANIAVLKAQRAAQQGALGKDNSAAKARLDLQEQGLGIDRGAANRQLELLGRFRDLLGTDYETSTGTLNKLLDIAGGDYNRVLGFLAQQEQFAGTERDLALRTAGLARDSASRQALSSATARGATTSKGLRDTNEEILRQYGITTDTAGNSYAQALASIGNKRGENQSSFDTTRANIAKQLANAKTDYDRGLLNNSESAAQARDRLAQLDLTAKDLGLQREQLDAALARGLADLGLQGIADANTVANMLSSNNANIIQAGMAIIQAGLGSGTTK